MPKQDIRTASAARKGKHKTAGRMNVIYKDAKGKTHSAVVLDQGTASGLKLAVGTERRIVDNVPLMTNEGSVSCYVKR